MNTFKLLWRIALFFVILLIHSYQTDAQEVLWENVHGDEFYNIAFQVVSNTDGSNTVLNVKSNDEFDQMYITKFLEDGTASYTLEFPASVNAYDLTPRVDGSTLVAGLINRDEQPVYDIDSIDYIPWLAVISPTGEIIQEVIFDDFTEKNEFDRITLADQGYYAQMSSKTNTDFTQLVKLSNQFEIEWTIDVSYEDLNGDVGLITDITGNLIFAGNQQLMKVDPAGNIIWSKTINENQNINLNSMTIAPDGHIIICGGPSNLINETYVFIQKYSANNGNLIWERQLEFAPYLNADFPNEFEYFEFLIEASPDNNGFILAGEISPDSDISNLNSPAIIARIDLNGALVWHEFYGEEYDSLPSDLAVNPDNSITVVGIYDLINSGNDAIQTFIIRVNDLAAMDCIGTGEDCDGTEQRICRGDLTFASQADINSFNNECQIIDGHVIIGGGDIFDLTPLSSITEIRGDLLILGDPLNDNDLLTSLDGLENLILIGDDLFVTDNENLNDCCILQDLINNGGVTNNVVIENNGTGCNIENCDVPNSEQPQKVVLIEGTAAMWSHWVPRQYAKVDSLSAIFDNALFVNIHNGDPLAYDNDSYFSDLAFTGWPQGKVNRTDTLLDPNIYGVFIEQQLTAVPPANIAIENSWDSLSRQVSMEISANFFQDLSGDYRFAVIIVEDSIVGTSPTYDQANIYSGGEFGVMGGYENLPDPVPASQMVYNNVARATPAGFNGDPNSLPESIAAGDTHSYTYTYNLPSEYKEDNIRIIAVLVAPDGTILNAGSNKLQDSTTSPTSNICTGDLIFTSQAEIDAFNPACEIIVGKCIIAGSDIVDLSRLLSIVEIRGDLIIGSENGALSNDLLTSLQGLNNLVSITGRLIIRGNLILENLLGLASLQRVGGVIIIENCPQLVEIYFPVLVRAGGSCVYRNLPLVVRIGAPSTVINFTGIEFLGGGITIENLPRLVDLNGLLNLTTINGDLFIINVPTLTNLDAFSNLIILNGCLHLIDNPQLDDITGLNGLQNVSQNIRLINVPTLVNVDDFSNLTSVGGIFVEGNENLINLDGFSNIVSVTDTLLIINNIQLSTCCIIEDLITNGVGGAVIINNNAEGCNSPAEITDSCDENNGGNGGGGNNDTCVLPETPPFAVAFPTFCNRTDGVIVFDLGNTAEPCEERYSDKKVITENAEGAQSVSTADLDLDGDIDIVLSSFVDDELVWFENDGNNNFSDKKLISDPTDGMQSFVQVVDFDNDGIEDVFSGSVFDNKLAWYRNNGNGTFGTENIITTAAETVNDIDVADLNNDGNLDAVSVSRGDGKVAWYKNDGGTFGNQQIIYQSEVRAFQVRVADFDQDGNIDLLVNFDDETNNIAWFRNIGMGQFSAPLFIDTESNNAVDLFIIDIELDGDKDFILSSRSTGIRVYENDGRGNFSFANQVSQPNDMNGVILAMDVDNDADIDIISTTNSEPTNIVWYENIGVGSFRFAQNISGDFTSIFRLFGADINQDGNQDFLSVSRTDNTLAWFENICDYIPLSDVEYSVDGGSNWQENNNFPGLASGEYSLTVRSTTITDCQTTPIPIELSCQEDTTTISNICQTDLIFTSQAEIDAFNPDCEIIVGNCIIAGSDIVDLSRLLSIIEIRGDLIIGSEMGGLTNDLLLSLAGLNNIVNITGRLIIRGNLILENLRGLENLQRVGGVIIIENCPQLVEIYFPVLIRAGSSCIYRNLPLVVRIGAPSSITFFTGIESLGGGITIENLPLLVDLNGLLNLIEINGDLFIINTPLLTHLDAFQNLIIINGCLHLIDNEQLSDLSGLNGIQNIGQNIRLVNISSLINVDDFSNLNTIGGSVFVEGNPNLINLDGFSNITSIADTLLIINNLQLATCCTIEDLIANGVGGEIIIDNNATGCSSVAEIEEDCEGNTGGGNGNGGGTGGGNGTSQITLSCPTDITIEAFLGEDRAMVSWELPTATTTCETGGCTIDSLDGFDFMGVYNGNLYYLSEQPEYWLVAREIAQQNGGDLVVINDAAENRFITDAIGFNGSVLIGLTDMETEGKFNWVDGTDLNYTNWEDGQPDNFMDIDRPENEDYAALHGWSRGQWADYNFYTQKHFVLEVECAAGIQSVVNVEQTTGGNNGTFFPLGTTQVTYRATDNCGADTTCVFNVTVEAGREQCDATTNLALGQPVRQSSTQDGAEASRAVDGNTNGVLFENSDPLPTGSVTQTQWEQSPWWEIDLGELYQISEIKLFNRTDCCSDFLQDFYILASPEPFLSDDLPTNLTQAGVVSYYQETAVGENATIGLNQAGRYVRIQLRDQGALSLAEVEILGCVGNGLRVNGGASQVNFGGYLNEENVVQLYAQNYAPVGAERLVIEKMDTDINFQTLSESVENNAARQSIIYQTTDEQPYEGDNYYRLKVLYQNGTFEYSPVVNVPFNPVSDFTVFPNPTSDYVDVYLKRFKNQDFNLLIINHLGIEINRFDFTNQQERFVRLDTSDLQDGLYFITIIRNGKTETRRLIIQKM